jgi:hypothetical protein
MSETAKFSCNEYKVGLRTPWVSEGSVGEKNLHGELLRSEVSGY